MQLSFAFDDDQQFSSLLLQRGIYLQLWKKFSYLARKRGSQNGGGTRKIVAAGHSKESSSPVPAGAGGALDHQ